MSTPKSSKLPLDLQKKIKELQDKLNRSLADYINLEKRIEREKELITSLTSASIIQNMLDVLDNFYLAQNHLQDKGLQMAIDKFKAVLTTHGLSEINPADGKFDPSTMECVEVRPGEDETILDIRKVGYQLNGQTIRPAQVVVGKTKN